MLFEDNEDALLQYWTVKQDQIFEQYAPLIGVASRSCMQVLSLEFRLPRWGWFVC